MTLSKHIIMIVVGAILAACMATFLITAQHTKNYFEEQLNRNSQDTATSLGLSLTAQMGKTPDLGMITSKVDAIFDRGYFSNILVEDIKGKVLVNRYLRSNHASVPAWFSKLIPIHNEKKSALIMQGWQQFGEVEVQSDSALAYAALWKTLWQQLFWFFCIMLLILCISVFMIKLRFSPLDSIIKQAQDIGQKNLYTLDIAPKMQELRVLSTTINTMVLKLKRLFAMQIEETEQLRSKVYKDSLTGLGNRRFFFQQLKQYLSNKEEFVPGFLLLVNLSGLFSFNKEQGYQEGDKQIVQFIERLDAGLKEQNVLLMARLDGPEFAVVVLERDFEAIESLAKQLYAELTKGLQADPGLSAIIGVVKCQFAETASSLMARVDKAFQQAQQGKVQYFVAKDSRDREAEPSKTEWESILTEAIRSQTFHFYYQPVMSPTGVYHRECFIKLVVGDREIAAREFIAIAESLGLGFYIDKLVLEKIADQKGAEPFAMNLSAATVLHHREEFLSLVLSLENKDPKTIQFEISESLLHQDLKGVESLIEGLARIGYTTGLDRVGASLIPFEAFKKLPLTYLKLDASLSQDLKKDKARAEFVAKLISTARSLDITLIATAIEKESQCNALKQLGISHFQGHYILSPREQR